MMKSPIVHFFALASLFYLINSVHQYSNAEVPLIELSPAELTQEFGATLAQLHSAKISNQDSKVIPAQTDQDSMQLNALSAVLDEKILLAEGLRAGMLQNDPVILERLLKNMAFTADNNYNKVSNSQENLVAIYQQALALGMDKTDPVIQRRILLRVKQKIRNSMPLRQPTDTQLVAFMNDNPEAFHQPTRWRFTQVYYDPRNHSNDLEIQMDSDKLKLLAGESKNIGDSSMLPRTMGLSSQRRISQQFGPAFANRVKNLDRVGEWIGPVESSYGKHWLRLDEKMDGNVKDFAIAKLRVNQGWQEQQKDEFYQQALQRMRNTYHIAVSGYTTTTVANFPQQWLKQG